MKSLLNRLVVTNTDTEADQSEDENDSDHTESVEWTDVSSEATDHPVSEGGPEDTQPSTDAAEPATSADRKSQSTPDTVATSDEVDTMDADELLDNVLNGLAEPTLVADSAGRISHINSNACEMFETQESAAIGASPAAVHGGEDLVARVLSTGKEITERQEEVVNDGKKRILSRTITPFHDGSGDVVGAMETAKDITEKVREKEKPISWRPTKSQFSMISRTSSSDLQKEI